MGLARDLDEAVKKWSLLELIDTSRRQRDNLVKSILKLNIKYMDENKNRSMYDALLIPRNQKEKNHVV